MTDIKYRTIVADPPWDYDRPYPAGPGHGVIFESRNLPYPSLSTDAIAALSVQSLAEDESRLFLWTTNTHLPEAFGIVASWGFTYKQTLVWHKAGMNLVGHVAPNSAEFILVGTKGHPPRLDAMPDAVTKVARKGGHSAKPECFLDYIEQVSPGPYVELFARRNRLGWDTWGNESLEMVAL